MSLLASPHSISVLLSPYFNSTHNCWSCDVLIDAHSFNCCSHEAFSGSSSLTMKSQLTDVRTTAKVPFEPFSCVEFIFKRVGGLY